MNSNFKRYLKVVMTGLLVGFVGVAGVAEAQVVTVDGLGIDRNSAIRDAMRSAVEQVVGAHINSKTLVRDAAVEMDEMMSKSQGYVKDVKVLSEVASGTEIKVKCSIDVNDSPSSDLLKNLANIAMLNDPRIAVVVNCNQNTLLRKEQYENICSSSINSLLLNMGFSHILDKNVVLNPDKSLKYDNKDTDYMVLVDMDYRANGLKMPSFYVAGKPNTNTTSGSALTKATTSVSAKIVKTDTKELIGQFQLSDDKMADTEENAVEKSLRAIGETTANQIGVLFAKKVQQVNDGSSIVARVDSHDTLLKLQQALSELPGVESVVIRNYENGKGLLQISSNQSLNTIYCMLKDKNTFKLFMENSSENKIEISVAK